MATDEQPTAQRLGTTADAPASAVPLTNGRHSDSLADAADGESASPAIGGYGAEGAVVSSALHLDGDRAEALNGDAAPDISVRPDSFPAAVQQLTEISLSQDLDSGSGVGNAVDPPTSSSNGPQPAAVLGVATSLDDPLPASTARIDSDVFFQDEDDATFTLDDDESPAQPSALASAPAAEQLDAERAAQDREDEDIQRRLQQQRETAKADATRSVSPPVYNRPMSPPPGSAPRSPLPPPGVEPLEFRGLLYYDGIDSVGRPVVVVNARADAMLQPKLRNRAMEYMKRRLEPIVYQGPYVLCMVASGHQGDTSSKLPAMWLIRAYRSLSRPYKKNVKYIVLVRPSAMLSTMMVVLRPFLSTKAARKLHKVDSLLDIDAVTGGDVKAEQLGARFLREELGVEPGTSLIPTAVPPVPSPQRAESLDAEVQLGSY